MKVVDSVLKNHLDKEKNSEELLNSITTGSNTPLYWVCDKGHSSYEPPKLYRNHPGACSICDFVSLYQKIDHLTEEYSKDNELGLTDLKSIKATAENLKTSINWVCKNNHKMNQSIITRIRNNGCSKCFNNKKKKIVSKVIKGVNDVSTVFPSIQEEWVYYKNEAIDIHKLSYGSMVKGWFKCRNCGVEKYTTVNAWTSKKSCEVCSNRKIVLGVNSNDIRFPELKEQYSEKNDMPFEIAPNGAVYLWSCEVEDHEDYTVIFHEKARGKGKCPICLNTNIKHGVNDLKTIAPYLLEEIKDSEIIEIVNLASHSEIVEWRCKEYSHVYSLSIGKRLSGRACPKCSYVGSSKAELELAEYISRLTNTIVESNNRTLIKPLEVDLYLPELKLAIEYNGDYWHSGERTPANSKHYSTMKDYHSHKKEECRKAGVSLYFVWEHQWIAHKETAKKELQSLLTGAPITDLLCLVESPLEVGCVECHSIV